MSDDIPGAAKPGYTAQTVLSPDINGIVGFVPWLAEHAEHCDIGSEVHYAIRLCLEEALTNVIKYGAFQGEPRDIKVAVSVGRERIVVEIIDDGRAFDPTTAEIAEAKQDLSQVEPGGLGIRLMREFSDKMDYARRDGRNHLTLEFLRTS